MIRVGDMVTFRDGVLTWNERDRSAVYPVIGVKSPNGSDVMVSVLGPTGEVFWEWSTTFAIVEPPASGEIIQPQLGATSCNSHPPARKADRT